MGHVAATAAALHVLETVMSLLPSPEETNRAADAAAILLDLKTVTSPLPSPDETD